MGTAYVSSDEFETHRAGKLNTKPNWWDMSGDASPRWVLLTLFTIFMVIFLWICGSTIFLSRQLNRDEQNLKKQGYRRINPDDPEARSLLDDLDDLSDDDEYYTLSPVLKITSDDISVTKDGPPSYEEAQNQQPFVSIPKYEILGESKAESNREQIA